MKHTIQFEGREHVLMQRPSGNWVLRDHTGGKERWITFKTRDKALAGQLAKDYLRARRTQDIEKVRDALRIRKGPAKTEAAGTLGQLLELVEQYPDGPRVHTRDCYVVALRAIIHRVHGKDPVWTARSMDCLGSLVPDYRHAINAQIASEKLDGHGAAKVERSACSLLRQARALFSPSWCEFYRARGLVLPPGIATFRKAPFIRIQRKKDYHIPSDALIQSTFAALEKMSTADWEIYLACWLALGFGLRASELSAVRTSWFVRVGGRIHLELESVCARDGEQPLTKNGEVAPRIPVANGAWQHIGPIVAAMPAGAHVFPGSYSHRAQVVIRKVNAWLRSLGWTTQKGIHELRAFAGSKVMERDGLHAASTWLRHGDVATTQKFYGRYARVMITDSPLVIPFPAPELATVSYGQTGATGDTLKVRFDAFCEDGDKAQSSENTEVTDASNGG